MRILFYLVFFYILIYLPGCSTDCSYKVFKEVPSPDSLYKVVKFYNWCGMTSSNNINLSILNKKDTVSNRSRMVFVCASPVGDRLENDSSVVFSWLTSDEVWVRYESRLQVLQKDSSIDGIRIRYFIK